MNWNTTRNPYAGLQTPLPVRHATHGLWRRTIPELIKSAGQLLLCQETDSPAVLAIETKELAFLRE
jgi:hypothetical protein